MESEKINFTENHLVRIFMVSLETHLVGMTGFEPATTRPPAVYANRTAPHPELYQFNIHLKHKNFTVVFFKAITPKV